MDEDPKKLAEEVMEIHRELEKMIPFVGELPPAVRLAQHVLRTTTADDAEPVTEEWLKGIGFVGRQEHPSFPALEYESNHGGFPNLSVWFDETSKPDERIVYFDHEGEPACLPDVSNRGELLALMRCLRISPTK